MKRLLGVLLAVTMLFVSAAALASDNVSFDPSISKALGWENSKWISSEYNRCLLAILIELDLNNAGVDASEGFTYCQMGYVSDGDYIMLIYPGTSRSVSVFFNSSLSQYCYIDSPYSDNSKNETWAHTFLVENTDKTYDLDPDTLLKVAQDLVDMMDSSK